MISKILTIYLLTNCLISITQSTSSFYNRNNDDTWKYKFVFTTNINSQLSVDCPNSDQIWIGWSHYGTRNRNDPSSKIMNINSPSSPLIIDSSFKFPNENDCWMNFTEKIAEQCNGADHCDISSQPTYIHKCGKISDYLYVSYKCIEKKSTFDICEHSSHSFSSHDSFYIKSTDFPDEYPSSLDCSCLIDNSASKEALKLEILWFSLQDNDYVNIFNDAKYNLSGWMNPTYEIPVNDDLNTIRFTTDDSLAYKGFWLKVTNAKKCNDDWQLVGDSCVKVFSDKTDWRSANHKCQRMNGNLLRIDDVIGDLKFSQYMQAFYPEVDAYWLGLRKYVDNSNEEKWMWAAVNQNLTILNDVSWWPWRQRNITANPNENNMNQQHCVIKRKDEEGYFSTSCESNNKHSFVCQTETICKNFDTL
jgi:hypothetical protein